jgi:hypothetical protein
MNTTFLRALFLLLPFQTSAQCSEFLLTALHAIQRADAAGKDAKIQEYGFDLHKMMNGENTETKVYDKCWKGDQDSKNIYEQKIYWHTHNNTIEFMTLDREHFLSLRRSIEDRQRASGGRGSDVYIGRVFEYHFGLQNVDGNEYHRVLISFKK